MRMLKPFVVALCAACTASMSLADTKKEDFSLNQTSVSIKSKVGDGQPASVVINGSLKNAKSTVYLVVDASGTKLIRSASVELTGKSTGKLTLVPELAAKLPVGKNTGKVVVRACKNQSCTSQYSGSPKTITVSYEVIAKASSSRSSSSSSQSSSASSLSQSSLGSLSSLPLSSSSSSASSLPVLACANNVGDVFFDEICSPWRSLSAYEQKYADYTNNYETTDGNTSGGARFNIVPSADAGRGQVVDIEYLSAPEFYGAVHIRAPESPANTIDMSEYAHGKIIFDLKVISHSTDNAALDFTLDCQWPCASTPKVIKAAVLNEWKTYEFSIAEMIERGLDIKRVSQAFMLLPPWGKQAGAHYQVDNIRWVKGDAPVSPAETICYSNFYDSVWNAGVSGVGVSVMGFGQPLPTEAIMTLTQGVNAWVASTPNWSLMNNEWLYMFSGVMNYQTGDLLDPLALPNCSAEGTLSLEIYTPAALVADGKMTFTLTFVDRDWGWIDLPGATFSVANMKPDDWNKVSVPLSAATYRSNWKYVGMRINATLVSPALQAGFNIDNIVIKHAVP